MKRFFLALSFFAPLFPHQGIAAVTSMRDCERILSIVANRIGGAKPESLDVLPEDVSADAGLPGEKKAGIVSSPGELKMALSMPGLPAEQFAVLSKIPENIFETGAVIYMSQLGVSVWQNRGQLNSWLELATWLQPTNVESEIPVGAAEIHSAQWRLADLAHASSDHPGIPPDAQSALRDLFSRGQAIQMTLSASRLIRSSLQRKVQEDLHLKALQTIEDEDLFQLALNDRRIERSRWTNVRVPLELIPASPSSPATVQIPVRVAQNFLRTILRLNLVQRLIGLDRQNRPAYLLEGANAWLTAAFPELIPYFWNFPVEANHPASEETASDATASPPLRDAGASFLRNYEFGVGGANPVAIDSTWTRFLTQDLRRLGISSLRVDLVVTRDIDFKKEAADEADILRDMGVRIRMCVVNGGAQMSERQKKGLKKLFEELMSRWPSLKGMRVKLIDQSIVRVALDDIASTRIDALAPSLSVDLERPPTFLSGKGQSGKAAQIYFYLMLKEFEKHRDLDFH